MDAVSNQRNTILVLGLGNDILGDDALGLVATRIIRDEFNGEFDTVEMASSGLDLLEVMEGYERALLLDSVITRKCPPGTILELSKEDFSEYCAVSPHYASLSDIFELAKRLEVKFPSEIRILAMEIEYPSTLIEGLSPETQKALPSFLNRSRAILAGWLGLPAKRHGTEIASRPFRLSQTAG